MYKTKCFNSLENLFGGRIIPKFYIFTNVCWLWIKPLLLCSMSCQDDHRWLIRQSVGFLRASWSHEMTELLLLRSIESPWFSLFLVQFSSVAQSCPTLCDPMDCSMPGFPVHHQLLEFAQTHVHRVGNAIQPSDPLLSPSPSTFKSFPVSGSFQMSQFFTSGGQSIGVSASASVLPMIIQDWFPLGLAWSPCSPRDSQESSPTPQFKSINSSAYSFLSLFLTYIWIYIYTY